MMCGIRAACASNIGRKSGTRSRMMSKFGSGATVTSWVPSSVICVLQASRGCPLMNMPHDPHTPMRQDERQASVAERVSLMTRRPSSTVIPCVYGMVTSSHAGGCWLAGSYRRILKVTLTGAVMIAPPPGYSDRARTPAAQAAQAPNTNNPTPPTVSTAFSALFAPRPGPSSNRMLRRP